MPFAQQAPLAGAIEHALEVIAHRLEALRELAVGEEIDLLFRKIDGRLDVGAQVDHRLGEPAHHGGELALQRAHRRARRLARAGVDQIRDRLGLRQIQLVVEEGALREFPGLRAACAELERAPDQRLHHHRAAVAVQLEHVLAGVGVRRGKEERKPRIERFRRSRPESGAKVAARAGGSSPSIAAAICGTFGPETRTMPIPPRPGGVAAATMVSVRVMSVCGSRLPPRAPGRKAP